MKERRKLIITAVASVAAGTMLISATANKHPRFEKDLARIKQLFSHHKKQNNKVQLLFIQQAGQGYITPSSATKGCYTLTLSYLKPDVMYFSNEPKRIAGRIPVASFVNTLKHEASYYKFQPNVAIQGIVARGKQVSEMNDVAVLLDPVYNNNDETLAYTACPLKKNSIKTSAMMTNVSLFFDNFQPWPP